MAAYSAPGKGYLKFVKASHPATPTNALSLLDE